MQCACTFRQTSYQRNRSEIKYTKKEFQMVAVADTSATPTKKTHLVFIFFYGTPKILSELLLLIKFTIFLISKKMALRFCYKKKLGFN